MSRKFGNHDKYEMRGEVRVFIPVVLCCQGTNVILRSTKLDAGFFPELLILTYDISNKSWLYILIRYNKAIFLCSVQPFILLFPDRQLNTIGAATSTETQVCPT